MNVDESSFVFEHIQLATVIAQASLTPGSSGMSRPDNWIEQMHVLLHVDRRCNLWMMSKVSRQVSGGSHLRASDTCSSVIYYFLFLRCLWVFFANCLFSLTPEEV